jgi:hypothetical protein
MIFTTQLKRSLLGAWPAAHHFFAREDARPHQCRSSGPVLAEQCHARLTRARVRALVCVHVCARALSRTAARAESRRRCRCSRALPSEIGRADRIADAAHSWKAPHVAGTLGSFGKVPLRRRHGCQPPWPAQEGMCVVVSVGKTGCNHLSLVRSASVCVRWLRSR